MAEAVEEESKLVEELKTKLKGILDEIQDEYEEGNLIAKFNSAQQALYTLQRVKLRHSSSSSPFPLSSLSLPKPIKKTEGETDPEEYCFNLLKAHMQDPVCTSNKKTYDRRLIKAWIDKGHRKCPLTNENITDVLTSNEEVGEMMLKWSEKRDKKSQEIYAEEFRVLLNMMSAPSVILKKSAARHLMNRTKETSSPFQDLFGKVPNAIFDLIEPLLTGGTNADEDLQADVIKTLLNLQLNHENKKLVRDTDYATNVLEEFGNIETEKNAALTICLMTRKGKDRIGNFGALSKLINSIKKRDSSRLKDDLHAISELCALPTNRKNATDKGLVGAVLNKIICDVHREHEEECIGVLGVLSRNNVDAIKHMINEKKTVPLLLSAIQNEPNTTTSENAVLVLNRICHNFYEGGLNDIEDVELVYGLIKKDISEAEKKNKTISKVARDGTAYGKWYARKLLEQLEKKEY